MDARFPSALLVLLTTTAVLHGEVIDRIAVSIDKDVIASSEVTRQLHITAMLNGEAPDLSSASRREAADRLVEQTLIRREMEMSGYIPEAAAAGTELFNNFRKQFPGDAAWKEALRRYHVSEQDIRDTFNWQASFLAFIEIRFRPGITIPEEELRDWYNEQKKRGNPLVAKAAFEDVLPQIEQILTQQRIDNALDRWLGQVRTQTRIQYREEAFR